MVERSASGTSATRPAATSSRKIPPNVFAPEVVADFYTSLSGEATVTASSAIAGVREKPREAAVMLAVSIIRKRREAMGELLERD